MQNPDFLLLSAEFCKYVSRAIERLYAFFLYYPIRRRNNPSITNADRYNEPDVSFPLLWVAEVFEVEADGF